MVSVHKDYAAPTGLEILCGRKFYKDFAPNGAGPQPRCGWEFFADADPG